jgi:hypothetical protein
MDLNEWIHFSESNGLEPCSAFQSSTGKCARCTLKKYFRKKQMSDCFENFTNYCQNILQMKYIIKNLGHWLNFCVIGHFESDFRIFCMSQCKIIQQLLRYHGDNVVCAVRSPGGALNTIISL